MAEEGDQDAVQQLATLATDPPELDGRWRWLWAGWAALQPSRPYIGGGMGGLVSLPLPWGVVEEYGARRGMAEGEREMLHRVIGALDKVQLKHDRDEAKRAVDDGGS